MTKNIEEKVASLVRNTLLIIIILLTFIFVPYYLGDYLLDNITREDVVAWGLGLMVLTPFIGFGAYKGSK